MTQRLIIADCGTIENGNLCVGSKSDTLTDHKHIPSTSTSNI